LVKLRRADGYPLKLIIMSATIDENKFATYFDNCPIIRVPGRLYPIKTFFEKEPRKDYLNATFDKVKYVIKNTDRKNQVGDILVFLPSIDDIKRAARYTKEYLNKNASQFSNRFEVFELYGQMEPDEQMQVFKDTEGKSKVIFSTNVAETSVTINGVRTVIDSGRVKEKVYDQERNISILKLKLITKSSSTQRKGRAGRCAPGTCYFLYTEEEYDNMEDMIRPEILRMHLGSVVLQ
jgi:HrpA-like RNA helicase